MAPHHNTIGINDSLKSSIFACRFASMLARLAINASFAKSEGLKGLIDQWNHNPSSLTFIDIASEKKAYNKIGAAIHRAYRLNFE